MPAGQPGSPPSYPPAVQGEALVVSHPNYNIYNIYIYNIYLYILYSIIIILSWNCPDWRSQVSYNYIEGYIYKINGYI